MSAVNFIMRCIPLKELWELHRLMNSACDFHKICADDLAVMESVLRNGYNYDSTSIRRSFDARDRLPIPKVIKCTVM